MRDGVRVSVCGHPGRLQRKLCAAGSLASVMCLFSPMAYYASAVRSEALAPAAQHHSMSRSTWQRGPASSAAAGAVVAAAAPRAPVVAIFADYDDCWDIVSA